MGVELHHKARAYETVADRRRALSILEQPSHVDGGYQMAAIRATIRAIDPIEWYKAAQAAKQDWARRTRRDLGLCVECGARACEEHEASEERYAD